jgi:hypothetical protein
MKNVREKNAKRRVLRRNIERRKNMNAGIAPT